MRADKIVDAGHPHLERLAALLIEYRLPSIGSTSSGFLLDYSAVLAPTEN